MFAHFNSTIGVSPFASLEHEKGHADAYFKIVKPWIMDELPIYLRGKKDKQLILSFSTCFYDLMLESKYYLESSAKLANEASKHAIIKGEV